MLRRHTPTREFKFWDRKLDSGDSDDVVYRLIPEQMQSNFCEIISHLIRGQTSAAARDRDLFFYNLEFASRAGCLVAA